MTLAIRIFVILQLLSCVIITTVVHGMSVDLYLNKDKFGEFFKLEISEKGCTNVPLNWENQAASLDTHGSCIKLYDLPYCRGKYVALQPYHGTFQDNLATLGFDKIISSASPCGPKVPSGRYYIQNGADGSVLTVESRNGSIVARTVPFKPYITKGQQFQVEKVALADYELIPRVHEKKNPITYDMSVSTNAHPVRRSWKLESVYKGKYIIKNEWNNRCLYKSQTGRVEEHECVSWSPNQEWMFRSIKVRPFFPTVEQLNRKPVRPDDNFPFEAQQNDFIPITAQQFTKNPVGGYNSQTRPHPGLVFQPLGPILPSQIVQGPSRQKQNSKKPPVPYVRHPGPFPFPAEPVVTPPRKPIYSTTKPSKLTKTKKNKDEDDEDDEKKSDEKNDDKKSEEKEDEEKKSDEEKASEEKDDEKESEEKDDKESLEKDEKDNEKEDDEKDEEEENNKIKIRSDKSKTKSKKKVEKLADKDFEDDTEEKPKYSDYRLYF